MNAWWWLALPVLLLPIWWHRQKRQRVKAQPLATARFLPRADPQQQRVWRWTDRLLLLVRCLLLVCLIAWLADLALPWRGDTVLLASGADPAWTERQIAEAGFAKARRLELDTPDAIGWLRRHENEWQAGARLLLVGGLPMPAALPPFGHSVELRSMAVPFPAAERHVAIVTDASAAFTTSPTTTAGAASIGSVASSIRAAAGTATAGAVGRAAQWRALFAALDGPHRYIVDSVPGPRTELIVWDRPDAPPAGLRAPLWWIADPTAFPELRNAPALDGLHYADSARGRLWASATPGSGADGASTPRQAYAIWPPRDVDSARTLFETWQRLHYPPVAYAAPSQVLAAAPDAPRATGGGALRDVLMLALIALFALERTLAHASRR